MKSFVSQGKTILDAIAKALIVAEFPINFSIKVLEKEIRSLLWWHNKPAVILFFYEIEELDNQNNQKKNFKKNYNKEEAFVNKKTINTLAEPMYTSTVKTEKTIHNQRDFTKKDTNNKKKVNLDNTGNELKDKTIKKNSKSSQFNSINEPQSPLGAALQNKIDSNSYQVKPRYEEASDEIVKNNASSFSPAAHELRDWHEKYIAFVQNWINELNKNILLSNEPIKITIENKLLFITIYQLQEFQYVSKKHLFSSIVILLYENLQAEFNDFDSKFFKIIIE
jgi:hypothetical protein